jgi:NADPH-dependent glutamate synthase beta subunit-like oxidoreductase
MSVQEKFVELTVKTAEGSERKLRKTTSPIIDTMKCLDCGECIKNCPTQAITEMQRQICRLCPDCAEGDIMFPKDMEELTRSSCSGGCPLGHYPEGYINLVAKGDWEGAWNVISGINPLPGILGRICERPCEEECKRGILINKGKPLNIRATKRAVADWAADSGKAEKKLYLRNIDKRVAVIGAGPAGITAAADLAGMGYKVTIFEATSSMGGMVRRAIPLFRLPDEVWRKEFEYALGSGIDIEYGVSLGHAFTIEDLFKDGFKAVVIATGAPFGKKLDIPGKDFKGVYTALNYMNDVKYGTPAQTGDNTVVIGGGSVATDAARTALRNGAKNVTMVCIENEGEMPAHSWEIEEALEEGVKVLGGYAPQSINSAWMQPESVTVAKVAKITKDANGNLRAEIDSSDTKKITAETVIFAVGQSFDNRLFDDLGFERNETGSIVK